MTHLDAIPLRHSVRRYTSRPIEGEALAGLQHAIDACNREGGLHIQLCLNEPEAFAGRMARYGRFAGVRNYIALVGPKGPALAETCGYYGEKIVLEAQCLGLHTCWVAQTYSKGKNPAKVGTGEKLALVISVGYGENEGVAHRSKPIEALCKTDGPMPDWFHNGMLAAQLAPTAINQQKFHFTLSGNVVKAMPGSGFYTKVDLGIAKYHFELGAGNADWRWAE